MKTTIDLSALKGLHIPEEPDFFPLALGWWIVIFCIFLFSCVLYFLFLRWLHSLSRQAWKEYRTIKKNASNATILKELNQLAKKVAIARFGRKKIAHLDEVQWIAFMNSLLQNEIFSKEYVDLLHKSMYAKQQEITNDMRMHVLMDYKKWLKVALNK